MIFVRRAQQLLQQRQDSNDVNLIHLLISGFSKQDESFEFKSFEVPALFPIEHVQEILSEIDKKLYVSCDSGKFLISIK